MLARLRSQRWMAYGAALISIVVALSLRLLVDPILKEHARFDFFFLAVSLAAWLGGYRPALFTALVSCLVGNYYFTHPYGIEHVTRMEELISILMFLAISIFIGVLGETSLRALDRARAAEQAKDQFMATVAHELRSPLSVIHYANALDRIAADSPARDHIDLIDRQVQHLNRMIQDLLDVSRIARGKIRLDRQDVDASAIVDGAVIKAQPTIESRKHMLVVDLPDEPLPLHVDPIRIEQVVANLLINAAKYTPEGGRISVRAFSFDESVVFVVRDNGIGISEEMLPRVFDLFVQADNGNKSSGGGLGIGLALARQMIEMHDGTVSAASAGPNRGSEFTVRLPIAQRMNKQSALSDNLVTATDQVS